MTVDFICIALHYLLYRCLRQGIPSGLQAPVRVQKLLRPVMSGGQKSACTSRMLQAHIRHAYPPTQTPAIPRHLLYMRNLRHSSVRRDEVAWGL